MITGIFEVLASIALLLATFAVGITFCAFGIFGAILGAIASIIIDANWETCAWWGFGIGMVIQLCIYWRRMLPVVVVGALGLLVGVGVRWLMHLTHCNPTFTGMAPLAFMLLFIYFGSPWMKEAIDYIFEDHTPPSDDYIHAAGNENQRCSNCDHYNSSRQYCDYHEVYTGPNRTCGRYL